MSSHFPGVSAPLAGASASVFPAVSLGAWGWRHEAWDGGFYGDELPPEWRLTFYSNEFDAVALDAPSWLDPAPEELEQWVEDTREAFRFHLVLPDRPSPEMAERLRLLAPRAGSLLLAPSAQASADAFAALAPHGVPLYSLSRGEGASGAPVVARDFDAALAGDAAPLVLLGDEPEDDARAAQRRLRAGMDALAMRRRTTLLVQDAPERMLARLLAMREMRALLGWH